MSLRRGRLGALGLTVIALVAFLPTLWVGFIADDYGLFYTTHHYAGLGWAFDRNDAGEAGAAGHFYRPLWVLWNAGIFKLSHDDTIAIHAAGIALFAVIVLEVWALARRLLSAEAAWVAAAAFALYPRHGETVAWISGNTDLTGVALALASLLCLLARWPLWLRVGGAALFAAAAALAKEVAFVLPGLALLLLFARPVDDPATTRRLRLLAPAAMVMALGGVLAAHVAVIGGIGGYSEYPWGFVRAVGVGADYVVAAASPPQLELTRQPLLLVVPALVLAALAWRIRVLWRRDERERLRVVGLGAVWFALAALPTLNLAIDLNNANGERLLFLSSVGLALGFAALVDVNRTWLLGAAGLAAGALCLWSAQNWVVGGEIARRATREALALAPRNAELVLLTQPESYWNAHIYTSGNLDAQAAYSGRPDVLSGFCLPMEIRSQRSGQVHLRQRPDGAYEAKTTWNAPFDFPVLSNPHPLGKECSYARGSGSRWPLGVGLKGLAYPHPHRQPVVYAYFDGRDVHRCC